MIATPKGVQVCIHHGTALHITIKAIPYQDPKKKKKTEHFCKGPPRTHLEIILLKLSDLL